ncbi:MAG: 3'(2'),5'-bisphosphate nucleotidase CysQ [Stagnimonas sp.]|nr:3'(2'),5'-bisphosphate nucleotidase CysQ [Stagnimonas sp.]
MKTADLLPPVVALAHSAGEAILAIYQEDFAVTQKTDDSPVTAADLAAHHLILDGLTALTPDIPVVSEEGVIPPASERATWTRYWLVDPLDGTREFIARNGEFTVNIALIENGRPVLGVVLAPALDLLYAATEGGGAWREQGGVRTVLAVRPWPSKPVLMLSRSHPDPVAVTRLAKLGDFESMQVGSSLKYCRIAEGVADAYPKFASIWFWDTAAAQCVLEQAGGVTLSLDDFLPIRYAPDSSLRTPAFIAAGDATRDWRALLAP